jgi:hypothetical protein
MSDSSLSTKFTRYARPSDVIHDSTFVPRNHEMFQTATKLTSDIKGDLSVINTLLTVRVDKPREVLVTNCPTLVVVILIFITVIGFWPKGYGPGYTLNR